MLEKKKNAGSSSSSGDKFAGQRENQLRKTRGDGSNRWNRIKRKFFPKAPLFRPSFPPLPTRDIFARLCALYPLIRKRENARGSLAMVVAPRCHGYLHASNKRWLRGSRLLLLGRVKRGSLNSLFLSPRLSSRLHSFSPLSPLSLLSLDNGFEVCCPRCFDRGGIPGRKKGDNRCAFFL